MGFDLGREECVGLLVSNPPEEDKAKVFEGFRLSASKCYEVIESSANRKDSLIVFEDGVEEIGSFLVPARLEKRFSVADTFCFSHVTVDAGWGVSGEASPDLRFDEQGLDSLIVHSFWKDFFRWWEVDLQDFAIMEEFYKRLHYGAYGLLETTRFSSLDFHCNDLGIGVKSWLRLIS
ncbi:hypothetical protein GQ457_13G010890 [Hibiscus cannabinus]